MSASYILGAKRTPLGKMLGSLSSLPAPQLAAVAIGAAIQQSGIDRQIIDEVVLGNVLAAGIGQAPARQAALAAELSEKTAALTINKMCGSGLKAVMLADQAIRAGDAKVVVAGGMESMSRAPFLLPGARQGWKFGHQQTLDSMLHDGLWCAIEDVMMGSLADYIAQKHQIKRDAQDTFAAQSHHLAASAMEQGKFDGEIAPVTVKTHRTEQFIEQDEGPRSDTTAQVLAKLRPAFSDSGTVTAGNASQISDGAAALVVADDQTAAASQSPIKARIVASATSGVAPKELFIAPVSAIETVLSKANLAVSDIDLFELNEAFAAQSLACMQSLDLPAERVNVHGGAIALGHPIGASGARILVTLLYALADRGLKRGLASLCLGGGNAVAMIVERP